MGSKTTQCNKEVVNNSDIVVLAVKPNMVRRILREVYPSVTQDHLVISLCAGISIDTLQQVRLSFARGVSIMNEIVTITIMVHIGALRILVVGVHH